MRQGVPDERPVHLIVVDSWVPTTVAAELAAGRLPALAHLVAHGAMDLRCASVFPSVTPACLAAIATGGGPDHNHITGVLWYDRSPDRYVHYWPYPQSLVWGTLSRVIGDFLLRLNGEHLSPQALTIFERLEAAGVEAASVNFPVSRGPCLHRARVPRGLAWAGGLPAELALRGPTHLRFGDMLRGASTPRGGPWHKYGFNDHTAATETVALIRKARPRFVLTYFNENDLRTHHHGPARIGWSLRRVDGELARLLAAYGSWDQAVREARWILVGDHSQSDTHPWRPGHAINVFKMFPRHRVASLRDGGLRGQACDFAVAPNDRMCWFYFQEDARRLREEVLDEVGAWPAVDQVLWCDGDACHAWQPASGARLAWQPGGPVRDPWGGTWTLRGAGGVFDLVVRGDRIEEGAYPNALARATSALSTPQAATLVLTARLGHEFTSGFPMGRGNHGSLHALDSWVPLVTVGVPMPARPRLTDVYGLVLAAFGLPLEATPDAALGARRGAG
ncbi:MAG: alkaline phosphatase family protein [Candidatus Sericytochromatia bacterium]|nr:alkaline phosphatase family protein [Candidatus Sericytochromatia bacterium]MEB3221406.1 alkaline phosphatase family protein [Candidatus Sericytochromatia bacterium]